MDVLHLLRIQHRSFASIISGLVLSMVVSAWRVRDVTSMKTLWSNICDWNPEADA